LVTNTRNDLSQEVGCNYGVLFWLVYVIWSAFATCYSFEYYFGIKLPLWAGLLIGLLIGGFTIPCAIIAMILIKCGVHGPLFHVGG
jgi:mannose/fructose/N-acetylgalactosamine-specific phosphotransferase system component IIC